MDGIEMMSGVSHPWPRLASLIEDVRSRPGESYRTIEARARNGIGRTEINNIVRGEGQPGKWPVSVPKLKALALGLGVPWATVRDAVALDTEATVEGAAGSSDAVLSAILADDRLLPEAKEHLIRQYGLLLRVSPQPQQTLDEQDDDEREDTSLAEMSGSVGIVQEVAPAPATPAGSDFPTRRHPSPRLGKRGGAH